MIRLQQQNPHLISAQSPDTPEVSRHHKVCSDVQQLQSQSSQQSDADEQQELEESEDLSDHERHEPDEEESNGTVDNLLRNGENQ